MRTVMSIERAEQLKSELTDKYVVVAKDVPELRRFMGLTGTVKTVNMNCRALVEFDGPEDIGWYDIDPSYLTVVDAPQKKEAQAEAPAKAAPKAAAKPAAAKKSGKSPLELAREQAAAKSGKAQDAASPKKKGLSPLEQARQQGATKSGGAAESAAPAKASKAPASKADTKAGGKKLSPLEQARQQGAYKGDGTSEAPGASESEVESESAPVQAAAREQPKPAAKSDSGGKPKSIIEQARQQGPFKG